VARPGEARHGKARQGEGLYSQKKRETDSVMKKNAETTRLNAEETAYVVGIKIDKLKREEL
jgi:hypothetical protein